MGLPTTTGDCQQCGVEIIGRRSGTKFCSLACGQKNANSRKVKDKNAARRYSRSYYSRMPVEETLLKAARARAKKRGLEFDLTLEDIDVPDVCPVLGVEMRKSTSGKAQPNSPSLDRVDSSKGYLPGNVRVISNRANTLKRDATIAELEALLAYMKRQ